MEDYIESVMRELFLETMEHNLEEYVRSMLIGYDNFISLWEPHEPIKPYKKVKTHCFIDGTKKRY